jgi:hypothetical protein
MSKFKVGDKVVVVEETSWGLVGTEGVIIAIYDNGNVRYKITGGKTNDHDVTIGENWYVSSSTLDFLTNKNKPETSQPKCFAEEQQNELLELEGQSEKISNALCPNNIGDAGYSYVDGEFCISGSFSIKEAIELRKWLSKMTAVPRGKPVKKVAKKKAVKKVVKSKGVK